MSVTALERLLHKYYGYVADLEGSGVAVLELLFVRDTIQAILHRLTPDAALSTSLSERIDDLDRLLRAERSTFLMVLGQEALRPARRSQGSPRAHWWWYLDELEGLRLSRCRSIVSVWRRPLRRQDARQLSRERDVEGEASVVAATAGARPAWQGYAVPVERLALNRRIRQMQDTQVR